MTKSSIDTLFYMAEIGDITQEHYATTKIDSEAVGFLLGNSMFKPYKILLEEIQEQKLAFNNYAFFIKNRKELREKVYKIMADRGDQRYTKL